MTCFRPNPAIRIESSENPVRMISSVQYSQLLSQGYPGLFKLPCGKCVGCRLAYSRGWAVRCVHESQLFEYNSFVTLTYDDFYNNRNGGSLNYRDFQLFMKRLRKAIDTNSTDYKFLFDPFFSQRYFMCGEYGTRTYRPHFHILFFNLDFDDKVLHSTRNGYKLFVSESLSRIWSDPVTRNPIGHAVVGTLTMESCGYVSRYCTKKALDADKLVYFNSDTGEFLSPEKTLMSRRPGIAHEWFKLYGKSIYTDDTVVMPNGFKCKPPRYYDQILEKTDLSLFDSVKQSRIDFASSPEMLSNSSTERLIVREAIQLKKLELLPRSL